MLPRKIVLPLERWANSPYRKPMVLRGARQVGKTVAVKLFGERYERFIYLDLERAGEADIFLRGLPIDQIFQAILLKSKTPHVEGRTLLFLDEIQNCPEAVENLRYFYEELPEIHVIAAGSLLEVALQEKHIRFPVGRVEHRFLHPITFKEFLGAIEADQAADALDEIPLPDFARGVLMDHFHEYALIGGMPEAVARWVEKNDITAVNEVYDSILVSYQDDVAKYARNPTMAEIFRHCIETAPFRPERESRLPDSGNRITDPGRWEKPCELCKEPC